MKTKLYPSIRFSSYVEEWTIQKFKDYTVKTGKKNSHNENYPAYSVNNKLGLVSQTEQFDGSRLENLSKESYKFVEPNEFAYNPARINVGSIAFNNLSETVLVSSLYVVIKMSTKIDNEYILQYIKSPIFNYEVKRNTEGSVREYLFYENFKNIKFPLPSAKEEQIKIGSFFKSLDDTISLHQQELEALKQTKQGFLQKMFPKDGETEPAVRFEKYTENWQLKKLGDILKVNSGRDYKHLGTGNIPVYGTGGFMLNVNESLSNEDAIGLGRKGTIDKPQLLKAPFWTVDTLFFMTMKKDIDLHFCYSLINMISWKKYDESTGVPSLSKTNIDKILVKVPSYEEQLKIGEFFRQLDEVIELKEKEIEALKETKRGFLQKMFV